MFNALFSRKSRGLIYRCLPVMTAVEWFLLKNGHCQLDLGDLVLTPRRHFASKSLRDYGENRLCASTVYGGSFSFDSEGHACTIYIQTVNR